MLLQDFRRSYYGSSVDTTTSNGTPIRLFLRDCAGREPFGRSQPTSYLGASLVVICFDISNPDSFRNINERWIPEIMYFMSSPRVPILLVGCKADRRVTIPREGDRDLVSSEQGHTAAATIGAVRYMECSALTGEGVGDIAKAALELATSWDPRPWYLRESTCHIM
jgi:GTPase SAR1 family protein